MKVEALTRPFPRDSLKTRPGRNGRTVEYVDIAAVIDRLNEAFEHVWSFDVEKHEVHETEVVVLGRLTAGGMTKAAFGGSSITMTDDGVVVSVADDLKAASSDALKKAASMLGVALEQYGAARDAQTSRRQPSATNSAPARPLLPQERVTARQLGALHGASRQRGFARGDLEALVEDRTGKRELGHLSRAEASSIIEELRLNGNGASTHNA
jgi:hypothetical protein